MQKLPAERRARIEAKIQELLSQVNTIKQIRAELGLSQSDLDQPLGVEQSTVSKLEKVREQFSLCETL